MANKNYSSLFFEIKTYAVEPCFYFLIANSGNFFHDRVAYRFVQVNTNFRQIEAVAKQLNDLKLSETLTEYDFHSIVRKTIEEFAQAA